MAKKIRKVGQRKSNSWSPATPNASTNKSVKKAQHKTTAEKKNQRTRRSESVTSNEKHIIQEPEMGYDVSPTPISLIEVLNSSANVTIIATELFNLLINPETPQGESQKRRRSKSNDIGPSQSKTSSLDKVLAALVNLLCRACGSTVELELWQVQQDDIQSTLEEVFLRIDPTAEAYLLVNKDSKYKNIRKNFSPFWRILVERSTEYHKLVQLLDRLSPWIISMSDSKSRAFRHTATLCAYSIISGLSSVLREAEESLLTSRRPADVRTTMQEITRIILELFRDVFTMRVRDLFVELRIASIRSLQDWMCEFPSQYVKPEYAKNLGFLLHDRKPEVRNASLEALISVYSMDTESITPMDRFTERFRERFAEMTRDVDPNCVEAALRLCSLVLKCDHKQNRLDEDGTYDRESLNQMLSTCFAETDKVRGSAGTFLRQVLRINTSGYPILEREQKQVDMLLGFVTEARDDKGITNAASYVVDALWNVASSEHLSQKRKAKEEQGSVTASAAVLQVAQSSSAETPIARSAVELLAATMEKLNGRLILVRDRKPTLSKHERVGQKSSSDMWLTLSVSCTTVVLHGIDFHKSETSMLIATSRLLKAMNMQAWEMQHMEKRFKSVIEFFSNTIMNTTDVVLQSTVIQLFHEIKDSTATSSLVNMENILKKISRSAVREMSELTSDESTDKKLVLWNRANALCDIDSMEGLLPYAQKWLNAANKDDHEESKPIPLDQDLSRSITLSLELEDNNAIQSACTKHYVPLIGLNDIALLECVTSCAYKCVMWHLSKGNQDTCNATEICKSLVYLMSRLESQNSASASFLTVHILAYLSDLALIPRSTISDIVRSAIRKMFSLVCAILGEMYNEKKKRIAELLSVKVSQEVLKGMDDHAAEITDLHEEQLRIEYELYCLTAAMYRLVNFGVLGFEDTTMILQHWTKVPCKTSTDIMKDLFRAARANAGQRPGVKPYELELGIVLQGFQSAVSQGESPFAVDAFQSLCSKLSQTHFMPHLDKYYSVVPNLIQEVVKLVRESPETKGLLMLGVSSFISRLRIQDATHFLKVINPGNFMSVAPAYKAVFLGALRRVAHQGPRDQASEGQVDREHDDEGEDFLANEIILPERDAKTSEEITYGRQVQVTPARSKPKIGKRNNRKIQRTPNAHITETGWRSRDRNHLKGQDEPALTFTSTPVELQEASPSFGYETGFTENNLINTVAKPVIALESTHSKGLHELDNATETNTPNQTTETVPMEESSELFVESQLWAD